jgi:O-antigen ligase
MSVRQEGALLRRLAGPRARGSALILLCVAAFVFGGGSRGDISSLILLRPLAFLLLAYALYVGSLNDLRRYSQMAALLVMAILIALLHLLPLSPSLWHALPGREIVRETDALVGLGRIARPLTLNVTDGINALFSLIVPVAALALVSVQRSDWRRTTLITILVLGGLSMALALLQVMGPQDGPFYFYRITSGTLPVGLFANRNHQAVFLAGLLPAIAVFAADGEVPHRGQVDRRPLLHGVGALGTVLLIIFVLATGSRAGLIIAVLGLASIPFVLGISMRHILLPPRVETRKGKHERATSTDFLAHYWRLAAAVVIGLGLGTVLLFGRFSSQLARISGEDDSRSLIWNATLPLVSKYFPWGSGVGSFVEVFERDEPFALLGPKYVNHAHNDFLEIALTIGLPGIALLALFLFFFVRRGVALWRCRKDTGFAERSRRLGFVVVLLLLLASLVDYPLRTPALMVVLVIAMAWLSSGKTPDRSEVSRA